MKIEITSILVCATGGAVLGSWFGIVGQVICMTIGAWIGYLVSKKRYGR